jgi:hypothetical protein
VNERITKLGASRHRANAEYSLRVPLVAALMHRVGPTLGDGQIASAPAPATRSPEPKPLRLRA